MLSIRDDVDPLLCMSERHLRSLVTTPLHLTRETLQVCPHRMKRVSGFIVFYDKKLCWSLNGIKPFAMHSLSHLNSSEETIVRSKKEKVSPPPPLKFTPHLDIQPLAISQRHSRIRTYKILPGFIMLEATKVASWPPRSSFIFHNDAIQQNNLRDSMPTFGQFALQVVDVKSHRLSNNLGFSSRAWAIVVVSTFKVIVIIHLQRRQLFQQFGTTPISS